MQPSAKNSACVREKTAYCSSIFVPKISVGICMEVLSIQQISVCPVASATFCIPFAHPACVPFIGSVVVPIQIRNQNSICGGDSQTVPAVLLVSSRVRVKFPPKSNKPMLQRVVL